MQNCCAYHSNLRVYYLYYCPNDVIDYSILFARLKPAYFAITEKSTRDTQSSMRGPAGTHVRPAAQTMDRSEPIDPCQAPLF